MGSRSRSPANKGEGFRANLQPVKETKMSGQDQDVEALADKQPYRNTTMVLAEPKTIHSLKELENKLSAPTGDPDKNAYRNSPLVMAEPKSIYDLYDTGHKHVQPSGDPEPKAYRNAPIVLAEPKTIYSLEDTGS